MTETQTTKRKFSSMDDDDLLMSNKKIKLSNVVESFSSDPYTFITQTDMKYYHTQKDDDKKRLSSDSLKNIHIEYPLANDDDLSFRKDDMEKKKRVRTRTYVMMVLYFVIICLFVGIVYYYFSHIFGNESTDVTNNNKELNTSFCKGRGSNRICPHMQVNMSPSTI